MGVIFSRRMKADGPEKQCCTLEIIVKTILAVLCFKRDLHVADVKKTSFLSGPFMAFADSQVRILYWHRKSRERNHLSAIFDMQVM